MIQGNGFHNLGGPSVVHITFLFLFFWWGKVGQGTLQTFSLLLQ